MRHKIIFSTNNISIHMVRKKFKFRALIKSCLYTDKRYCKVCAVTVSCLHYNYFSTNCRRALWPDPKQLLLYMWILRKSNVCHHPFSIATKKTTLSHNQCVLIHRWPKRKSKTIFISSPMIRIAFSRALLERV